MTGELEGQMSIFAQGSWFGKTCQERCQAESQKEKISESSSKKRQELRIKPPQFLDLRTESGLTAERSWETDSAYLGEFTTRSFGESPNVDAESRLSQILTDTVPQKYFLSAKACQGILRRAMERGKELPKVLKEALERQASLA